MPPHPHPDAIADCVLNAFHALPQKCKPRTLADGRREWVPLAGIVLSRSIPQLYLVTIWESRAADIDCWQRRHHNRPILTGIDQ